MAQTRQPVPWKQGDPFSASHLNEGLGIGRAGNLGVLGGGISTMPNGSTVLLPRPTPISEGLAGEVTSAGPNGESDSNYEMYWVQLDYLVGGKWDQIVDLLNLPKAPSSSTTYNQQTVIFPVTNLSERQPGGPAMDGTHILRVGTPVLIYPIRGIGSDPSLLAPQFIMYCTDMGYGQYQYMNPQMVAQNVRGWDYARLGPLMNSNS
jgi:hypothetical protein